ncbi:hypothetical protein DY000_02061299 [Brassica cretica]|uniref:Uncharacterized protein n=1 Tax=Brassica cretica TaxID=69181 RepID=A0ABQ7ARW7_BRACR|nr:hypothetical protein DY000_02061299 [Brassica cretica]
MRLAIPETQPVLATHQPEPLVRSRSSDMTGSAIRPALLSIHLNSVDVGCHGDMAPGKTNLVLECCKGDKFFLILRLVSDSRSAFSLFNEFYDNDAALKIADSEFARSLQPRGLAETLWFLTVYGSRDYAASKV